MDLLLSPQLMLLLTTITLSTTLGVLGDNSTDRLSLLFFKAEITDDPHRILSSWNESTSFCQWRGVSCSRRHHRVTLLDLESLQLKGQLSSHIGNLSFLRTINLQNNSFEGKVPPEIGRLFRLRSLELQYNFLDGEIPINISHCFSLQNLSLYHNNLTGLIPKGIGSLAKLEILELGRNNLRGEIPTSFGNLSSLVWLYLNDNRLHGGIPSSLGELKRLNDLVIGGNNLSGPIPPSIYNLSSITQFCVEMNELHGHLPVNIGIALPELEVFLFHTNRFSGPVPLSVSNASKLLEFDISTNSFSGNMPILEGLFDLEWLSIHENRLGHDKDDDLNFLYSLINCTHLGYLSISQNNFGGVFPEIISNLSKTVHLIDLGTNQIRGSIPAAISNLVNLQALGFYENLMTGSIPSSIGKLHKLHIFDAFNNKLSGPIPESFGNLSSLSEILVMYNNLRGSIPPSLGECKQLQALVLNHNNFGGPIPKQVMSLSSLVHLELSSNNLSGSVPSEVEKLVNLVYLDISNNKLSGEIPKALGSCTSLIGLYLEGNLFHGSIPSSFQYLRGIEEIDLSRNNLSGPIPLYLGSFRHLKSLNISWNDFEGEVPVQGIFRNTSAISIVRNQRLCGGVPQLELPICTMNKEKKHKVLSYVQKLIVSVASGLVALVLILLSAFLYLLKKNKKSPSSGSSFGVSFLRVSYRELLEATGGFSSANLIGIGSFGSVYRGSLVNEGKNVAVKVLNLRTSKASKSFVIECKALKSLRHRNLVKLLTVCSSTDFQGNDFKALVYEHVVNGSLEEWLHPSQDHVDLEHGQRYLNLIQRVNIAIHVANALDYLHNNSHMPTIHCDLKPSNVLLESDMTARVGDFGLARFLPGSSHLLFSSHLNSSSMGMRGSIGYVPPEYGMGSDVSTLGDVYSYGILLLEMFTGKRPTDAMFIDDQNIREFASTALPEHVEEIVDPTLIQREYNSNAFQAANQQIHECLVSIIGIGLACSTEQPQQRMNISNVVGELCRSRDLLLKIRIA